MKFFKLALLILLSEASFAHDVSPSSRPVEWKLECTSIGVSDGGYYVQVKSNPNGNFAIIGEILGLFGEHGLFEGPVNLTPTDLNGKCNILISDSHGTNVSLSPEGGVNDIAIIQSINGVDYRTKQDSTLICFFANNFRSKLPKCTEH